MCDMKRWEDDPQWVCTASGVEIRHRHWHPQQVWGRVTHQHDRFPFHSHDRAARPDVAPLRMY